ncbi:NAD(P)-dependent oxidoreductase [Clostridium butyricum]|uniref:NAD(P)-dependent oxidoreductase n=1 Tax=Clostridium butyricum TaxID=1492 RepID=UPI001F58D58C|nr:NAD(P)-dependent oxidoreductase [Clostridium butyricum]
MISLVGYTGFVGSNLANNFKFDNLYNSKNIEEAYGTNPDLLVYSGVPAEKFLANNNPEKDMEIIKNAFENIKKINPKRIVLISTIDVYKNPINVDEDTKIDTEGLLPYGYNRYKLERMVEENFDNHLIVRLPGLYGENIKKNFIYDLINFIPSLLNEQKYSELISKDDYIKDYYLKQENGFYKCIDVNVEQKANLKTYFEKIGFSALNFTDSRSIFQFYNLSYLWEHINIALDNGIEKLNLATEPVSIEELYKYLNGTQFINEVAKEPFSYNYRTKYFKKFKCLNSYIFDKEFILNDIKKFIDIQKQNK